MISIYTQQALIPEIEAIIEQEDRLNELVQVFDILEKSPVPGGFHLIARAQSGIQFLPDWWNTFPPYIFPEYVEPTPENLLGIIFAKLGNWEKATFYLDANPALLREFQILFDLIAVHSLDPNVLTVGYGSFDEYRLYHNSAVLRHYASMMQHSDPEKVAYFYEEAIHIAPNDEWMAYSARHYAVFLIDQGMVDAAEKLINQALVSDCSKSAVQELKTTLCNAWMRKLVAPYDLNLIEKLKNLLWEVLQTYLAENRKVEAGLLLVDAAQIATYAQSFTEALGYLQQAIDIFEKEDVGELLGQAHYQRGILLYVWAKDGNPQFYKAGIEAFNAAAKVFTREEAPEVFCDIQQYLGGIYAEIPDEPAKRSIWAGLSASAFQQALAYYTKEKFPYEYAMVCNNYAGALTQYPDAVHTDNFEKALFYYNEALDVRTAEDWPVERVVSLLNYIEAAWHLNLDPEQSSKAHFEDMMLKAREARYLSTDPKLTQEANKQLERLNSLRTTLDQE